MSYLSRNGNREPNKEKHWNWKGVPENCHKVMALSSTATILYISRKNLHASMPNNGSIFSNSISFATKQRRVSIRNSGDVSSETPATEAQSEKSIDEAPKGPPSLISALNVERALMINPFALLN
ncbi:hypothetical protein CRYUN_Cryun33cG0080400 [Craigia yunnanensis]